MATTPKENEEVCNFLVDASRYGFTIRTVEAPFFRRVTAEGHRGAMDGSGAAPIGALHSRLRDRLIRQLGLPTAPVRAPSAATRDGKGIIFIAANGDVYPSGFMPLRLGSIRNQRLVDIYRDHSVLQQIRAAAFSGACGDCDYAQLCGGSRARSFASSGDPLGSDPGCIRVADSVVARK
jgi:radical SAM protein with 4Fe4S-binding SPASM domain